MQYPHTPEIESKLRERGYSEQVITQGLNRLMPSWERTVDQLDTIDPIDDYLNALDGRKAIGEILLQLDEADRMKVESELTLLDERFRTKTIEVNENVWGKKSAQDLGLNKVDNWYYYRVPQHLSGELDEA